MNLLVQTEERTVGTSLDIRSLSILREQEVGDAGAVTWVVVENGACVVIAAIILISLLFSHAGDRSYHVNNTDLQVEFKSHQWFGATVRSHGSTILVRLGSQGGGSVEWAEGEVYSQGLCY